eukprot:g10045.t1
MAIGGERFEARKHSVISGGGSDIEAMAEQLPLADGLLPNQSIEKALGRFAEAAASSPTNPPSIPSDLEGVLREIAVVGVPYYGWGGLKELLATRMVQAVDALQKDSGFLRAAGGKDYQQRRDELVASLRSFDAAPFTLQRLAEVLQDPRRQYSTTHKLINGLERLLSVSTTLPTAPRKGAAPPPPPIAASTTMSSTTTSAGSTSTATANSHIGAPAAMAAGQEQGQATPSSPASSSSSSPVLAVKVEEKQGEVAGGGVNVTCNGSNGSVDSESTAVKEREPGGREVESNGKQGPGRKRLKVDVKQEAPVMSE